MPIDAAAIEKRAREIEARLKAATPGPWRQMAPLSTWIESEHCCGRGPIHVADVRGWGHLTGRGDGAHAMDEAPAMIIQNANGAFIANAPDDISFLLAALRSQREEVVRECIKIVAGFGFDDVVRAITKKFPAHTAKDSANG